MSLFEAVFSSSLQFLRQPESFSLKIIKSITECSFRYLPEVMSYFMSYDMILISSKVKRNAYIKCRKIMALVGYARVSSVGQSLDVQLDKLKDCRKIFQEKKSAAGGKSSTAYRLSGIRQGRRYAGYHPARPAGAFHAALVPDCR